MKPSIWVSPDARHIIALDKVAAMRPEGAQGYVTVLLGSDRILLNPTEASHFSEAFLRFHHSDQPHPAQTKTQHDHI